MQWTTSASNVQMHEIVSMTATTVRGGRLPPERLSPPVTTKIVRHPKKRPRKRRELRRTSRAVGGERGAGSEGVVVNLKKNPTLS